MKKLIIPIFAALAALQGCVPANKDVVPDKTAKEIFTAAELQGIDKMIAFVDKAVVDKTNEEDIDMAYHACLENIAVKFSKGETPSVIKDTVKFKFLESLSDEEIGGIWILRDFRGKIRYKDTVLTDLQGYKMLNPRVLGNYLNYMEKIGESDSTYIELAEFIKVTGDIPLGLWFPEHHREYDFTTFKDRLWATVFLLRLQDPFEERIERYLKEQEADI